MFMLLDLYIVMSINWDFHAVFAVCPVISGVMYLLSSFQ